MGNRNAFTALAVKQFSILPNNIPNPRLLKTWLDSLSDKEFEELVVQIESGETFLTYIIDNFDVSYTMGELKAATLEVGAPIYSKVVEEDPSTGLTITSNEEHWVAFQPKRRQIQDVDDKRSIPDDSNTRDMLTGQVTGASKGSAIAMSQLSAIVSRNCLSTATEFSRLRGGDVTAGAVFNKHLSDSGMVSVEAVALLKSNPTVNESLASYLNAMHIANNVVKT
jgi:hypothetical protein